MPLPLKQQETWTQDLEERDLWHGENGVIVNTAALEERSTYFDIVRVPVQREVDNTPNVALLFV